MMINTKICVLRKRKSEKNNEKDGKKGTAWFDKMSLLNYPFFGEKKIFK